MLFFTNSTNLPKEKFDTVIENIFLHTNLIECESGAQIKYIENITKIDSKGFYIIQDKEMLKGRINSISCEVKYFIPNEIKYEDFRKTENKLFTEKDGVYILSFDIISFILALIYNNISLSNKENYQKYQSFQRVPFAEYILLDFTSELKKIIIKEKYIYAEQIKENESYFLPTFDYDRIRYFKRRKDIIYFIKKAIFRDTKAEKYLHLRKILKSDPWNKAKDINGLMKEKNLHSMHFVFVENRDIFASRYSLREAKNIIKGLNKTSASGVHLTYESAQSERTVKKQIKRFNSINEKAEYSRFHYLYPINERVAKILCSSNLKADFSVGMRGRMGFINGFSKPYRLFNKGTLEFPVVFMDSAIVADRKRENCSIEKIADEVNLTNGVMTIIFHPSSLDKNTYPEYAGILDEMILLSEKIRMRNISIESLMEYFSKKIILKKENGYLVLNKNIKASIKLYIENREFMMNYGERIKLNEEERKKMLF